MYRELPQLLRHAKQLGLTTTVTSNGTLLDRGRLDRVAPHLDGIALSLDGPSAVHDRIRASPRAFSSFRTGLEAVQRSGLSFGLVHTVTEHGFAELGWVGAFAAEAGARLLQIHPLELAGRAVSDYADEQLQEDTLDRLYLAAVALEARYAGSLAVQLDVFVRRDVLADPELAYAGPPFHPGAPVNAAHLGSLVVEADGTAVPVSYGMARRYAIGNLNEGRLAMAWRSWSVAGYPDFRAHCRAVFDEIRSSPRRLVNWHELVVARSLAPRAVVGAGCTPARCGLTRLGVSCVPQLMVDSGTCLGDVRRSAACA